MKNPIAAGVGVLSLLWGIGGGSTFAQINSFEFRGMIRPASSRASTPDSSSTPSSPATAPRLASLLQETAPAPTTPPGTTPSTDIPQSNETDLSMPKADKAEGGGEPTEEAAAEEAAAPAAPSTNLLMKALGMEESPVKIYGWIQNSYTGNANGTPKNGMNFGVNPNNLANSWMGNQYYLIFENPLEQNDKINFGWRIDNLFGNDWEFNHMHGLFDTSFQNNHFAGYDPAQMYAEVHLPYLTKGGIDIKGGRFYTILGYEVVPAVGRPLLSVPYMFNYGQPFTHLGMLSTLHLTDRINVFNGTVNGYDRWINATYKWNYLGGWTWTSKDGKAAFAMSYITGPNQYPRFIPANTPVVLPGIPTPPYLSGRINSSYGGSVRTSFTNVFSYKWTDKLTQVIENDDSIETNMPGVGPGGTTHNAEWYSFGNWFLYSFNDKLTGVWRSEVFRDNNGVRTGLATNYYEMTVGLIYKPKPWLWIRPEIRYDWVQSGTPYSDGTRSSQLTLGVDAIVLY